MFSIILISHLSKVPPEPADVFLIGPGLAVVRRKPLQKPSHVTHGGPFRLLVERLGRLASTRREHWGWIEMN